MAVDNERPPLVQSDVPDKPTSKVEELNQTVEPTEDNDEDELQINTTEVIDESLKLTAGDAEDTADNSEHERRER